MIPKVSSSIAEAGRRVGQLIICAVFPLGLFTATFVDTVSRSSVGAQYAIDFRPVWRAGSSFLDGASPYPEDPAVLTQGVQIAGHVFVYPVAVAAVFAPLSAFSYPVAAALFTVITVSAWLAALWLLGVRDWRCYGIAFAMPATSTSVTIGTLTPLLALALACAWRWRHSPYRCGLSVAAALAAKIFLWPLLIWLLVMRRWMAAAVAIAGTVLLTFVPWAGIGFRGLREYPTLMTNLADVEAPRGFGAAALIGTGPLLWSATAVAVGLCAVGCLRSERVDVTFAAMTLLAVVFSPIVWLHYFALVIPLIAIWQRRLSGAWFVPLALWVTPWQNAFDLWRIVLAMIVLLVSSFLAARRATLSAPHAEHAEAPLVAF
jgi:hypothetical protein